MQSLRFWAYSKKTEALKEAKAEMDHTLPNFQCPIKGSVPLFPVSARPVEQKEDEEKNAKKYVIKDGRQFTFDTFELGYLLQALTKKPENPMNRQKLYPEDIPEFMAFDSKCIEAVDRILSKHGCTRRDLLESEGITLELYERILKINFAKLPRYNQRALSRMPLQEEKMPLQEKKMPLQEEKMSSWQKGGVALGITCGLFALFVLLWEGVKSSDDGIKATKRLLKILNAFFIEGDLYKTWELLPTLRASTEGLDDFPYLFFGLVMAGVTLAATYEVYTHVKNRETWADKSLLQKLFLIAAFFCIMLFALDGQTDFLGLVGFLTPRLFNNSLVGLLPAATVTAGGAMGVRARRATDDQDAVDEMCRRIVR